jgi:DNA repair protein RecN (Recombination protein N)
MLTHLSIHNYALIRQLEIDFTTGFTVITGETGAGKSILLGALNLMLGKRADIQVLFDKTKKCVVEGVFSINEYNLQEFFDNNDLEYDNPAILRREIGNNGKTRAFINDTPVNTALLKELGEQLIDIHSQHQTVALNDANFQLTVIDSFAGITDRIKAYRSLFTGFIKLKNELDRLTELENKSKSEQDYLKFLFEELESAKLIAEEQEKLEKELQVLNHAEEIKSKLHISAQVLGGNEMNILNQISDIRTNLIQVSKFSPSFEELSLRLESVFIELSDLFNEIEKNAEAVNFDQERINEIKERLDLIYRLQSKHRVATVNELIELQRNISLKLNQIATLEDQITNLILEVQNAEQSIKKESDRISEIRKKHFVPIQKEIEKTLFEIGMPHAKFSIRHQILEFPGKDGSDAIKFTFNANKGGELMELSKVASGGELSRLMLAIKSMISQKNLLPTVIFDEIDIGVSGKVADRVGAILSQLSRSMQVIAITHLPQIAGKGDAHYFVYKETDQDSTKTEMKILNPEERVIEIAKMLSGQEVTNASVETAKHLLKQELH